jgi:hypothetical protein
MLEVLGVPQEFEFDGEGTLIPMTAAVPA